MKTKQRNGTIKVSTWLPLFNGFYGTIWESDSDEDMVIENINELRKERGLPPITWDDVEFDYDGYRSCVAYAVTNAVGEELKRTGLIQAYKLEKLVSPREYNFSNDSINVQFTLAPRNQAAIKAYLEKHVKAFDAYLKDRYTSYDGFMSSYSNRIADWMGELDHNLQAAHQLGSILNFILKHENQISEYFIYNHVKGNGAYLEASNYSELVPDVKKKAL